MPLPRPSRQPHQEVEAKTSSEVQKLNKDDFRPSDVFRFDPKPDITAGELAHLVSIFWTLDLDYDRFFSLTSDLQQHFRPIRN